MSARLDRCVEDVRIQALVIAKLELVDVEMQILLADFVERAYDPAFHDGPETFDGVGMHGTKETEQGHSTFLSVTGLSLRDT